MLKAPSDPIIKLKTQLDETITSLCHLIKTNSNQPHSIDQTLTSALLEHFGIFLNLYQQYKVVYRSVYTNTLLIELVMQHRLYERLVLPNLDRINKEHIGTLFELIFMCNSDLMLNLEQTQRNHTHIQQLIQKLSNQIYEQQRGMDSENESGAFNRGLTDLGEIYEHIRDVLGDFGRALDEENVISLLSMTHFSAALFGLGYHYRHVAATATQIDENLTVYYDEAKDKLNSNLSKNFFQLANMRLVQETEVLRLLSLSIPDSLVVQTNIAAQVVAAVNSRRQLADPARKLQPINIASVPGFVQEEASLLEMILEVKRQLKPVNRQLWSTPKQPDVEPNIQALKSPLRPMEKTSIAPTQPNATAIVNEGSVLAPPPPPAPASKGAPPPPPPPKKSAASSALKINKKPAPTNTDVAGDSAAQATPAIKSAAAKASLTITPELLSRPLKKADDRQLNTAPIKPKGTVVVQGPIGLADITGVKLKPRAVREQAPVPSEASQSGGRPLQSSTSLFPTRLRKTEKESNVPGTPRTKVIDAADELKQKLQQRGAISSAPTTPTAEASAVLKFATKTSPEQAATPQQNASPYNMSALKPSALRAVQESPRAQGSASAVGSPAFATAVSSPLSPFTVSSSPATATSSPLSASTAASPLSTSQVMSAKPKPPPRRPEATDSSPSTPTASTAPPPLLFTAGLRKTLGASPKFSSDVITQAASPIPAVTPVKPMTPSAPAATPEAPSSVSPLAKSSP